MAAFLFAKRVAAGALIWLTATAAMGQERAPRVLVKEFPPGEEVCYGRAYDASHPARRPRPSISALYLFNDFTPDPLGERRDTRERLMEEDRSYADRKIDIGSRSFSLFGRFRDGAAFRRKVSCELTDDAVYGCRGYRDSDDEQGRVWVLSNDGALIVKYDGLFGGLDVRVRRGYDDLVTRRLKGRNLAGGLRLERLPVARCLAERDSMRPPWAHLGAPLSQRFAERQSVCYARRYDPAHLARHPQQRVVALALRTKGGFKDDPDLDVEISMRLRDGPWQSRTVPCWTNLYSVDCGPDPSAWGPIEARTIRLVRAGERTIDAWIPKFRQGADEANRTRFEQQFDVKLGGDDQLFRLAESEDAACESR